MSQDHSNNIFSRTLSTHYPGKEWNIWTQLSHYNI